MAGRIFDDRGNRMSPSHARKGGIKYRYYLSSALLQGAAERMRLGAPGPGRRNRSAGRSVGAGASQTSRSRSTIADLVNTHIARVEVQPEQLVIQLTRAQSDRFRQNARQQASFRSLAQDTVKPAP